MACLPPEARLPPRAAMPWEHPPRHCWQAPHEAHQPAPQPPETIGASRAGGPPASPLTRLRRSEGPGRHQVETACASPPETPSSKHRATLQCALPAPEQRAATWVNRGLATGRTGLATRAAYGPSVRHHPCGRSVSGQVEVLRTRTAPNGAAASRVGLQRAADLHGIRPFHVEHQAPPRRGPSRMRRRVCGCPAPRGPDDGAPAWHRLPTWAAFLHMASRLRAGPWYADVSRETDRTRRLPRIGTDLTTLEPACKPRHRTAGIAASSVNVTHQKRGASRTGVLLHPPLIQRNRWSERCRLATPARTWLLSRFSTVSAGTS